MVTDMVAEHAELERRLADPSVHADPQLARRLGRRYAELGAVVRTHDEWRRAEDDLQAARELAEHDDSFAVEAEQLATDAAELADRLRNLLLPRDPNDDRDVIMEIKAGEGGEESALFAGGSAAHVPPIRRASRLADRDPRRRGVRPRRLQGRLRRGQGQGHAAARHRPYARLKYEGGVHRVQRVPVTE